MEASLLAPFLPLPRLIFSPLREQVWPWGHWHLAEPRGPRSDGWPRVARGGTLGCQVGGHRGDNCPGMGCHLQGPRGRESPGCHVQGPGGDGGLGVGCHMQVVASRDGDSPRDLQGPTDTVPRAGTWRVTTQRWLPGVQGPRGDSSLGTGCCVWGQRGDTFRDRGCHRSPQPRLPTPGTPRAPPAVPASPASPPCGPGRSPVTAALPPLAAPPGGGPTSPPPPAPFPGRDRSKPARRRRSPDSAAASRGRGRGCSGCRRRRGGGGCAAGAEPRRRQRAPACPGHLAGRKKRRREEEDEEAAFSLGPAMPGPSGERGPVAAAPRGL